MASEAAQDWRSRSTIKIEECAPIIGISRASAYDAARSGEIPTLRIGRRILVPVAALRRLLGENESTPAVVAAGSSKTGRVAGPEQRAPRFGAGAKAKPPLK